MSAVKGKPAPLNLAALVAPLPNVVLPNGVEVAMKPLSADGYERFRRVQQALRDVQQGEPIDEGQTEADIDACLSLVLPTATAEDLASFGLRIELKLAVLTAASGRVDVVLREIEKVQASVAAETGRGKAGRATRPPRSPRSTTSAP